MRWTEGHIHVAMRKHLVRDGWLLIAGEYPGGSDHQLYPLNVVDPAVARDASPDPRRHSRGELIPDLIALRERQLFIGEAKVRYDAGDKEKLEYLLGQRRSDFVMALRTFAKDRRVPELLPIDDLVMCPVLVFLSDAEAPLPPAGLSYLRISSPAEAHFEGHLRRNA
jgi:hypothetical protein